MRFRSPAVSAIALSIFLCGTFTPALAQITLTPPPEVSALMAACTPTDAQADAVISGLRERGWSEPEASDQRAALISLTGAHLWSFLPGRSAEEQHDALAGLTDRVAGALPANGTLLTLGEEKALILWNGEGLSCLWAGPETSTIDTLAVQLGGPLPESTGATTRAINQRVEAGGRMWRRQMAVGRTPATVLPPALAGAAITDAARLDRWPD